MYVIGELSKRAGVPVQTVRFYEREGLLEPPVRNRSGYRTYDDRGIVRLNFIKHAQQLGFSLKEIRELIALQNDPNTDCGKVRVAAEEKLRVITEKLSDLQRMQAELSALVDACSADGAAAHCNIIECLSHC